jgi:hypothetical protein
MSVKNRNNADSYRQSLDRVRTAARDAGGRRTALDATIATRCSVLCRHPGFGSLDILWVTGIFATGRKASLFKLNEFGTLLCTCDRHVRLLCERNRRRGECRRERDGGYE